MHPLGIHHITAADTDPLTFVGIAAEVGCQEVSLFTRQPGAQSAFPLVDRAISEPLAAALRDTGIRLANVESFMLLPDTAVADFRDAMELGAEFGARGAVAQVLDPDESRLTDKLHVLCDMAEELGLNVAIEFMALTPAWNTLPDVAGLVSRMTRANLRIGLDILHLVRSGGTPADVAALDPNLVAYAQLCDGANLTVTSDYVMEASANRLVPGTGVFPLAAFLEALPPGTPLELEVPQPAEIPPLERVRQVVASTRRLLDTLAQQDS
jgi:sugar phosphate isomerase/epimerase